MHLRFKDAAVRTLFSKVWGGIKTGRSKMCDKGMLGAISSDTAGALW